MKITLYTITVILVLISIGINIISDQIEFPSFLEPLISGLAISFVTGAIVYFMTVDHPRKKLDKNRIELVKGELEYKLERIETRLKWLNGLDLESNKIEFKSKLSLMKYGDITSSKYQYTVHETLIEIKELVEEFKAYAIPLILTIDDKTGIMDGFKDYLHRPSVLSEARMYVRNDLDSIKNKTVDIGDELHDLILKMVVLNKLL